MGATTAAYQTGTIPGVSYATPGSLASPNYSGIARPGSFAGAPGALPGTADNPNIPSTYQKPGVGSVETPYRTIDVPAVPAVPVNSKQLSGESPYARIPTTTPSGYLPASRGSGAPSANPSLARSMPSSRPLKGAGLRGGYLPLDTSGTDRAFQKGLENSREFTDSQDKKWGRGYNPDYVDHGPVYNDGHSLERMGYANAGDAWKDAGRTIADLGKKAINNLANWFNPNRYRDPSLARPNPTTPQKPDKTYGTPGVRYHVTGTYSLKADNTDRLAFDNIVTAPFSIVKESSGEGQSTWSLKDANGKQPFLGGGTDLFNGDPKLSSATRVDGVPEPESNRTAERAPDSSPFVYPNDLPAPLSQPQPEPQQQNTPAPTRQANPFPDTPGIPSPTRAPAPTQNPTGSPTNAPAPAPLNPTPSTPGQKSPESAPLKAPDINPSPTTTTTPTTTTPTTTPEPTTTLDPNTKQFQPPETPTPTPTPTPENCSDPCVQKLHDKADANKPTPITVKVFKGCHPKPTEETGKAIFEDKTLSVPKLEADSYKLLYARIAQLEALQCEKPEQAIAAVPEWWQIRPEHQRPQLVILFAEVLSSGKLTNSRWGLAIPHYNRPKSFRPNIPNYEKGSWQGILVLKDNSKIIVNAKTRSECSRVLNALKINVPVEYRTVNGKAAKAKIGERLNADLRECRVTAIRADFFSTGQRNMTPDWSIDLRKK